MNLSVLLPVISQMAGRDLTPEAQLFFRARSAIGTALSPEGQAHFIENWRGIVDFMETEKGQAALKRFLGNWETASKAEEKQAD